MLKINLSGVWYYGKPGWYGIHHLKDGYIQYTILGLNPNLESFHILEETFNTEGTLLSKKQYYDDPSSYTVRTTPWASCSWGPSNEEFSIHYKEASLCC